MHTEALVSAPSRNVASVPLVGSSAIFMVGSVYAAPCVLGLAIALRREGSRPSMGVNYPFPNGYL